MLPARTVGVALARRSVLLGVVVSVLLVISVLGAWTVRSIGEFLVVNEPLEPAQAIVILSGESPQSEREAARLYAEGWAPRVIVVRGADEVRRQEAFGSIGMNPTPPWAVRQQLLVSMGVPRAATSVADEPADSLVEQANVLRGALSPSGSPVLLLALEPETRSVQLGWSKLAAVPRGIVRAVDGPFDPGRWWTTHDDLWLSARGLTTLAYVLGARP